MTGTQLKSIRHRLNLTQAGLAEKLGMTRESISWMENGHMPISPRTEMSLKYLYAEKKGDV